MFDIVLIELHTRSNSFLVGISLHKKAQVHGCGFSYLPTGTGRRFVILSAGASGCRVWYRVQGHQNVKTTAVAESMIGFVHRTDYGHELDLELGANPSLSPLGWKLFDLIGLSQNERH